uniref:Chordin like 2 n=1 Tax=Malurus cyaneus samueli TaxID=2593467 RepID=A0A8C5TT59_9PASS
MWAAAAVGSSVRTVPAPSTQSSARNRPDAFCDFNGKKYSPGESWHPYLEPQGMMYCIRCSCSENTNTRCYRIQCPAVPCANPVTDPEQCCPRCPEPPSPSGLRAPARSCRYNGTTFRQGELFSGGELFPGRQPNQCVQCSCSEGQIYCGLVTCPELLCSSPQSVPDSCCQVCKGDSRGEQGQEERERLRLGQGTLGLDVPGNSFPKGLSSPGSAECPSQRDLTPCGCGTWGHGTVVPWSFPNLMSWFFLNPRPGKDVSGRDISSAAAGEFRASGLDEVSPGCGSSPGRVLVYSFVPQRSDSPKDILRTVAIERDTADEVEIYNWKLMKGIFHLIQTKRISKQEFKQEAQNFRLITRTNEETKHWNVFQSDCGC